MQLGWLDVCLRVANIKVSRQFYEGLGFHRVEGDDADGWGVVVNGSARIGLFEKRYMGENAFTLNFRGADVFTLTEQLQSSGYVFAVAPRVGSQGGATATMHDPDGHVIFFDTAPGETKKD